MVMNHDNTLDRTMRKASDYSKVTGNVRLDALTLKEIRRDYVLESTVPEFRVAPPTLEEFLLECKKCGICPMLHSSYSQAHRLATEIMGDNWVCFSSDYEKVKAVRDYSNCTILWSVDSGTADEIIQKLDAIGGDCGISSMEYSLYTPEFVSAIRDAGYHVQCSCFSEGEEYTYSYKYDDAKDPIDVRFVITTRGKGSYCYVAPSDGADGYLAMPTEAATTNRFGAISIPPFIDRYPMSVDVSTNKGWFVGTGGFPVFGTVSGSTTSVKTFPVNI